MPVLYEAIRSYSLRWKNMSKTHANIHIPIQLNFHAEIQFVEFFVKRILYSRWWDKLRQAPKKKNCGKKPQQMYIYCLTNAQINIHRVYLINRHLNEFAFCLFSCLAKIFEMYWMLDTQALVGWFGGKFGGIRFCLVWSKRLNIVFKEFSWMMFFGI